MIYARYALRRVEEPQLSHLQHLISAGILQKILSLSIKLTKDKI